MPFLLKWVAVSLELLQYHFRNFVEAGFSVASRLLATEQVAVLAGEHDLGPVT